MEPELQARNNGDKFCEYEEFLPLSLAHGLVRNLKTIDVVVWDVGGTSAVITLDAVSPTVGEAKKEIDLVKGASPRSQALYRLLKRRGAMAEAGSQNLADERPVREDDAESDADAYSLDDDEVLSHGDEVQLVVSATNYDGLRVGSRLEIRRFLKGAKPHVNPNKNYHYVYAVRVRSDRDFHGHPRLDGTGGDFEYWVMSYEQVTDEGFMVVRSLCKNQTVLKAVLDIWPSRS
jgi:hypothetical protein